MERTAPGISELFFISVTPLKKAETDDFPELLIPFYITKNEAEDILGKWCKSHSGKAEAKILKDHLSEMTGVYLLSCFHAYFLFTVPLSIKAAWRIFFRLSSSFRKRKYVLNEGRKPWAISF